MKNVFILFLGLFLFQQPAFSQGRGGIDANGSGHGVQLAGQVYLLDLYETGNLSPVVQGDLNWYLLSEIGIKLNKPDFDFETKSLLAIQIKKIFDLNPVLGSLIVKGLSHYDWSFSLEPLALQPAPNLNSNLSLVQIAVREPLRVLIDYQLWLEMSSSHRAALVLHEVLSSLIDQNISYGRVRPVIAALFNDSLVFQDMLTEQLNSSWPSAKRLGEKQFGLKNKIELISSPMSMAKNKSIFWNLSLAPRIYFSDQIEPFRDVLNDEPRSWSFLSRFMHEDLLLQYCDIRKIKVIYIVVSDLSLKLAPYDPVTLVTEARLVPFLDHRLWQIFYLKKGCTKNQEEEMKSVPDYINKNFL